MHKYVNRSQADTNTNPPRKSSIQEHKLAEENKRILEEAAGGENAGELSKRKHTKKKKHRRKRRFYRFIVGFCSVCVMGLISVMMFWLFAARFAW